MLGTLSGWPPCLLCLPTRACAQPGLAVRTVSAIGAHLELAGQLRMVGLGMLRSPAAVHALGLRAEGHLLAVHAHRSKDGGAAWFLGLFAARNKPSGADGSAGRCARQGPCLRSMSVSFALNVAMYIAKLNRAAAARRVECRRGVVHRHFESTLSIRVYATLFPLTQCSNRAEIR